MADQHGRDDDGNEDLRREARGKWLTMLRSLPATGLSHEATLEILDEGRNER